MNAESAKRNNRIGTQEFYEIVEKFHSKCVSGKKISADDVRAFYDVITSTAKETSKNIGNATLVETTLADKTSKILHQLGQNKEVIEAASKTISQDIKFALDRLTLYLEENKKKSRTVGRKDADNMPRGQGEN